MASWHGLVAWPRGVASGSWSGGAAGLGRLGLDPGSHWIQIPLCPDPIVSGSAWVWIRLHSDPKTAWVRIPDPLGFVSVWVRIPLLAQPPTSTTHASSSRGKLTKPENLHITSRMPGRDQNIEPLCCRMMPVDSKDAFSPALEL